MMRVGFLVGALLLAAAGRARAADEAHRPAASSALSLKLAPVVRFTLRNGLRVALVEDHRLPRVAVHVAYRVGGADDRPGYSGLAHLVEHLTFRASRHVPAPGAWALLERFGATEMQGVTQLTWTKYWCVIPARQLENALWIESDRMAFGLEKIDQQNLERERSIVSQELRLRQPGRRSRSRHLMRALFPPGHPYYPSSTELEDLKGFEVRHVRRFMQEFYRPDNATLAIVGDFDAARVREMVERYFGPIVPARVPIARRSAPAVELRGLKRLLVAVPERQEEMTFAWIGPATHGTERKSLELALDVLAARLRHKLMIAERLASGVSAGTDTFGATLFSALTVRLSPRSDAYRVENALGAELEGLHRSGVGEVEFSEQRVRSQTQAILATEDLAGRAAGLAEEPPIEVAQELRELRAIDASSVRAAAHRHLSRERRLVAYYKHQEEAPSGGEVLSEELAR
jgi:zinc protease